MQVTEFKILHLSHMFRREEDGKSYSIGNEHGTVFLWWTLTIPSQGSDGPRVVCAVLSNIISFQSGMSNDFSILGHHTLKLSAKINCSFFKLFLLGYFDIVRRNDRYNGGNANLYPFSVGRQHPISRDKSQGRACLFSSPMDLEYLVLFSLNWTFEFLSLLSIELTTTLSLTPGLRLLADDWE